MNKEEIKNLEEAPSLRDLFEEGRVATGTQSLRMVKRYAKRCGKNWPFKEVCWIAEKLAREIGLTKARPSVF